MTASSAPIGGVSASPWPRLIDSVSFALIFVSPLSLSFLAMDSVS